ncbi:hypothetical protein OSB04_000814 [Centaurea solstitialis]|uniref:CCHC-type domain-containing protein n=1 Tax=Centaurea solstitialis TaxID=347529 RepID=A0AA38U964_9ASTR|nr:hypothetical protein OSB04_000814 [Centaurea solstitialis]
MGDDAKPNESVVPGIINYSVILKIPVKLNSTNWAQWSMFVQTGLESLDKDAYLTKDPPNPKTREWKLDDSGIRMALWNAMEPQILTIAQNYPTTKKMWEHLQSSFSAKESLSHTYSVFGSYFRCEQGDSDLTEYYTRLSKLAEELRVLFPVTPDVKVQEERLAKMDVMTFISGLSPKYSSARPLLLSHTASKSLASTYHLAREMYSDSSTAQPSPGTDASALTFSARNNGKGGNRKNDFNKKVQCNYCKEYGHIKYNCPNRPPGSHPPPRPPRAQVASTDATTDVYPEASGQVASTPRANTAHAEHLSEPHPDPAPQSENEPNTDPAPQSENEPNTDPAPQSENEPNTEPYDPPGAPLPEVPIAFRKGTRNCTRYPIQNYLAYSHLSPESYAYQTAIDSHHVPRNVTEALNHPGWFKAMQEEMDALQKNET